jgi:PhnB protein
MAETEERGEKRSCSARPYLTVKNGTVALEFYKQALSAREIMRRVDTDGRLLHAEVNICGARVLISDEYPEIDVVGPQALGGSTCAVVLEVEDADAVFAQAVGAGAQILRPTEEQFQGTARLGKLKDPFGQVWFILSRLRT